MDGSSGARSTAMQEAAATELTIEEGVAWLTLDRPEAANARNQRMREELLRHYADLAINDNVRVVVLTGRGDRHFCAGMDLKEAAGEEGLLERRSRLQGSRDIDCLADLPQPTIAAINGTALGGGLEMALACDLRVAVSDAQLGLPEVGLGLLPGGGGTQRLPRLVGIARAMEMMLLAQQVSGAEAARQGLVNDHVDRAHLAGRVGDMATAIAAQPFEAVRYVKEAITGGLRSPWQSALIHEADLLNLLIDHQKKARR